MYRVDVGDVFGQSVLYKDDEKVEQIKKINEHLTILHFMQEKREKYVEKMDNILKASGKDKPSSPPLVGSSLPE